MSTLEWVVIVGLGLIYGGVLIWTLASGAVNVGKNVSAELKSSDWYKDRQDRKDIERLEQELHRKRLEDEVTKP
jgi:hypothetical protein